MRWILFFITSMLIISTTVDQPVYGETPHTAIQGAGEYSRLFDSLKTMLEKEQRVRVFRERERTIFVPWIRDHIHVTKAMKYLAPDIRSFLEFYLETQTPEGIFFDYYYPIEDGVSWRMNLFEPRYWKIYPRDKIQMHRLPVEADLEYLMVEGVYAVWQASGDQEFVKQWLPSLEKGMRYMMRDPLRWSEKYQLVKRGYTLDTWDFMQLPTSRQDYSAQGLDVQEGIFDIGPDTPMGIMHGDNSGMYAACKQLSLLHAALGQQENSQVWNHWGEIFRIRTNQVCWNGKYYAHFVEDDPMPGYLKVDQKNTLSLSNPYDINRGLPTEEMAQSIIQTYLDLKEKTRNESFAEWFGIYPAVQPHYADHEAGSYVNGGVLTIVAGELAKAAFQHGYEEYGADILLRLLKLVDQHNGDLPVGYRPDGNVDSGIPDNWGQAAVFSAMVEGLAGLVDGSQCFETVEISPRWIAAGITDVNVSIAYPASGKSVIYTYSWDKEKRTITVQSKGDMQSATFRILLPKGVKRVDAMVDGMRVDMDMIPIRDSVYGVLALSSPSEKKIRVQYE